MTLTYINKSNINNQLFHLQVQQLGHLLPIKDKEPIQVFREVSSIAGGGLLRKLATCGLKQYLLCIFIQASTACIQIPYLITFLELQLKHQPRPFQGLFLELHLLPQQLLLGSCLLQNLPELL